MATLRDNLPNGAAEKRDRRSRKRLAVFLNTDGTPDWDATGEEVRERLGMNGQGVDTEPVEPVSAQTVGFLLQTLTRIEAAVCASRLGISNDSALSALMPNPLLADQINETGARVLNKYPSSLLRWQDEIALTSMLMTWQIAAIAELRGLKPEPKPDAYATPGEAPPPIDSHQSPEPIEA